jgi:hypothetical protein
MAEVGHRTASIDGMVLVESYHPRDVYEGVIIPWLLDDAQKGRVVLRRHSRRTRCRRVWFSDPDTAFAYKMKFG